jgi:succinyl-CoA synthetase beta subunit
MDLLEYQGKRLFAKHGVPVPDGRPATTVPEAVRVGRNPTQVSEIAVEILGTRV